MSIAKELLSKMEGIKTESVSSVMKSIKEFKSLVKNWVVKEGEKLNSANLNIAIELLVADVDRKMTSPTSKIFNYSVNDEYHAADKYRKAIEGKYKLDGTGDGKFHNSVSENVAKNVSMMFNVYLTDRMVISEGPGGMIVFTEKE